MKTLSVLLIVFITIVLGVVLATTIADVVYENVNPLAQTNESLDITSARTGLNNSIDESVGFNVTKVTDGEILAGVSEIRMENGTVLTASTDYIANVSGDQSIYFKRSGSILNNASGNITLVDYTHQTDQYVVHSIARTLVSIALPLFFVIAIVVFVIFTIKNNIIDKALKRS